MEKTNNLKRAESASLTSTSNVKEKVFAITKRLGEEITAKLFEKPNVRPDVQRYKYLYIISRIIYDRCYHKGNYIGCKLNTRNLTAELGTKTSHTCEIIRDLVTWGVIKKTSQAKKGIDSARYALTEEHENDKTLFLKVNASEAKFINRLDDDINVSKCKLLQRLKGNVSKLSINQAGVDYLNNQYSTQIVDGVVKVEKLFSSSNTAYIDVKATKYLFRGLGFERKDIGLVQIYIKNFNTSRPDNESRVYHNLTNLKRTSRPFILFDGKPLLMTDICNSQVLISVVPIIKEYSIMSGKGMLGLPEDVKHYQQLAESGEFYEYLMEKVKYTGDRQKFKKQFYSQVFFSKVVNFSMQIKDGFISEFPNVYKLINRLKARNHSDFAISMQRLEASIMIDVVAKKMIKAGRCILTLHDAIVCNNIDDIEFAEKLIAHAMVKYGITPKFKRETAEEYVKIVEPITDEEFAA